MPPLPTYGKRPVVLLTNDDGPPAEHSPNIYAFSKLLREKLGWDVRVVVPDGQNSWVGKAYAIHRIIEAQFFYPQEPDGLKGEITTKRRPLKEGETSEWVLLSGTPATCTNIALHNLYPGEIDLVISGPNHGRNSSAAFAMSSGTIGAALASALSVPIEGPASHASQHVHSMPSIAVSYGVVTRPVPAGCAELAADVAVDVCRRLFEDWGWEDAARKRPVQLYSVNIPLVPEHLAPERRRVCFTTLFRNTYGKLFEETDKLTNDVYNPTQHRGPQPERHDEQLRFEFKPAFQKILNPDPKDVPRGTDAWAFLNGYTSVTPLGATYGEVGPAGSGFGDAKDVSLFWDDK